MVVVVMLSSGWCGDLKTNNNRRGGGKWWGAE